MNWTHQVCLLTGASGGIGSAIAEALADKGVTLLLQGRDSESLQALAARLPGTHGILTADLSTSGGRHSLIQQLNEFESISMLINNAGTSLLGELTQLNESQLEAQLHINLLAPMALTQAGAMMISGV